MNKNINLLNSFFDKIFVINLKQHTDRREYIEKNLKGLNYEFFEAVDGRLLNKQQLIASNEYSEVKSKQNPMQQIAMNMGQIGCALSHKKIYETIISNNYKNALILEDDVSFNSANLKFIPKILSQLPADWQLFYLGYQNCTPYGSNKFYRFSKFLYYRLQNLLLNKKHNIEHYKKIYPQNYSSNINIAGRCAGTYGYAVTNSLAEVLIKKQTPISNFADILLIEVSYNKIYPSYSSNPIIIDHQWVFHSTTL